MGWDMATATVQMELDVPEGIRILGCERHGESFAFEVDWPWPARCVCKKCGHEQDAAIERKGVFRVIRDLDVWGKPGFFTYQVPFHRCGRCGARQELIPPFRRERAIYTYRFEEMVIRLCIGSTIEAVAKRLGVSAEMIENILDLWASERKTIDPSREIRDIGLDEISLKKGHKLYVTILSDLTDPERPMVLAVFPGRDEEAAAKCLTCLSAQQRKEIRTHRTDMCKAFPAACKRLLPDSRHVADRFHVAKRLGEVVDDLRKKNHPHLQETALEGAAQGVQEPNVGVSPPTRRHT
jgi:transposase